jgi:hypothetical protein
MGGLSVSHGYRSILSPNCRIKKRQDNSTQWRNYLGQSIGMYDAKFIERQNYIASDGTSGRDYWVMLHIFPVLLPLLVMKFQP